jgi:predicted O-linked N-acetylglucosamine transferase (SPINDLY family)
MAGSILHAAGLEELVTTSAEDYENLATLLATQPKRLANFRDRLSEGWATSALSNADRHRRDMEAAFEGMMGRYLSQAG